MLSRALRSPLKQPLRCFLRFNSTKKVTSSPVSSPTSSLASAPTSSPFLQLLSKIKLNFNDNPNITAKIDSLLPIIPSESLIPFSATKISIGIVQSPNIPKGLLLDCLIEDPLGGDNHWLQPFDQYRQRYPHNNIHVTYSPTYKQSDYSTFGIKSPFLNKDLRIIDSIPPSGQSPLKRSLFNDIDLIDINNKQFSDDVAVDGVDDLDFDTNFSSGDVKPTDCQLYIYVKSKPSEELSFNDYPSLVVIDKELGSSQGPRFTVDNDDVEVDLNKVKQANAVLTESPENVSSYLELVKDTNSKAMLYALGKETSGYRPLILLLTSLLIDLRNSLGTESVDDDIQLTQLRRQIAEWTQNSHLELQTKVTPYMDEVIMNKFTKLFQVVGNSDQLALTMANYMFNDQLQVKKSLFSSPIRCHGSLVDSNSNLNYLEGKIDGIFPSDEKSEPLSDPLKGLKKNVTQNMLPSLQGKLNSIFLKESIEIPFPVFCITTWGYIIDYIDLNTGAAIFTFSLALAAYKMSQGIYKEVSKFKDEYLDDLRVTIDKNLVYLNDKLSQNVNKYGSQLKVKTKLIEQLDAEVENVTSVQKKLEK